MSDTPMTDAVENTPSFNTYNKMLKHAHRMERDRALLLDALKATLDRGSEYTAPLTRKVIAEVEKSE